MKPVYAIYATVALIGLSLGAIADLDLAMVIVIAGATAAYLSWSSMRTSSAADTSLILMGVAAAGVILAVTTIVGAMGSDLFAEARPDSRPPSYSIRPRP